MHEMQYNYEAMRCRLQKNVVLPVLQGSAAVQAVGRGYHNKSINGVEASTVCIWKQQQSN
jgi:hypothetical protein